MEIEAKFRINGREDLERALRLLKGEGYDFRKVGEYRYTDTYYDPGDGGALRFREYGDGRIVRTYKRDRKVEGGVIYREETEREVSKREMEEEKGTPILQTITRREEYRAGDVLLTYDVVWYDDSTQMPFLEVEGPEEDVRRIANVLRRVGLVPEERSKLAIGLALKGEKNGRS